MANLTYEEHLAEYHNQKQKHRDKIKVIDERERDFIKRHKVQEAKKRTHRLVTIGGKVESVSLA